MATDWQTRYYHADGVGSIRRLTDEAGNITDGYTYSAFGELLAHTGTDPQPYAFTGEPLDPNSGFQYHRARWMDPRVGRFTGMDPFRGSEEDPLSLHKYLYASVDPFGKVDPSGKFASVAEIGVVNALINIIAGNQASLGLDVVTEVAFKDNFTVQAIVITAKSVVTVAGLSALALRLTRSGFLARFLARRGIPKEGPGVWARANEYMSPRAAAYQTQITGRAAGEVYVLDGIKFDGFKEGLLLDAKGPGYAKFVKNGTFRDWFDGAEDLVEQAANQTRAAAGAPITWHVAEEAAVPAIQNLLQRNGFGSIRVVHTPPVS